MTTKEDVNLTFRPAPGYAPWPDKGHFHEPDKYNTTHLPEDVVATEFALIVMSRTTKEHPRRGGMNVCLNFGGRMNPTDLTHDEAEYVREMLLEVVRMVSA